MPSQKSHHMAIATVVAILTIGLLVSTIVLWKSQVTDLTVKVENYGDPVDGVRIQLISYSSGEFTEGETSYDGSVTFHNMPRGLYSVGVFGWGVFTVDLAGFWLTVIVDIGYDYWYYP